MRFSLFTAALCACSLSACSAARAQNNQLIFSDALQNGWQSWGWAKTIDLKNPAPAYGGAAASIRVGAGGWEAIHLHHSALDVAPFGAVSFWVCGGEGGGQKLRVQASRADKIQDASFPLDALKPNEWRRVVVPLDALGVSGKTDVTGIVVGNNSPDAAGEFFLDDVELLSPDAAKAALSAPDAPVKFVPPPPKRVAPVEVVVDAGVGRHPISPLIYGVNFAEKAHAALRPTLNRWGGNSTSRYNWQQNAHAIGADYFFESVPDSGDATPGAAVDALIQTSKDLGAAPMVTIPINGWVGKLGPNREKLASFSVAKYGPQQKTEQWVPDAGNGSKPDGKPVEGNDPTDANMPATPDFQAAWVKHLVGKWGTAKGGGVRYYLLDNEPGLWATNHRDVIAVAPTAAQLRDCIIQYARAIKAADPGAKVVGPEEWGWNSFLYSPFDVQDAAKRGDWNPTHMTDRKAIGGQDFQPWLLGQIRAEENRSGQKLLDVFTNHIYPQGNGIGLSDTGDTPDVQRLRARSTRALWDANYTDESWINAKVALIPRMKKWVRDNAPGMQTGITEYNWGNDASLSGAAAQADLLGIFGREGLDIATRWCAPIVKTPTFAAFQLYRNYDGRGAAFGDTSIKTVAPNPDVLSAFGALRTQDGALTAMVIHKEPGEIAPLHLRFAHFTPAKTAQHFAAAGDGTITRLPDVPVVGGSLLCDLSPQSVNLFVVPKG